MQKYRYFVAKLYQLIDQFVFILYLYNNMKKTSVYIIKKTSLNIYKNMNRVSIKGSTPLTDLSQSEAANNKYRKAIKQINKLISINTSVKKQLINVQEQYDNLRKKYNDLEQKFLQLSEELDQRISYEMLPLGQISKHVQSIEEQISSQGQIQILKNKDQENRYQNNFLGLSQKQKQRRDNYSPLSGKAKQLENTGTLSEYIDTKRKLEEIQEKLVDKDKEIQNLMQQLDLSKKENASLYEKYVQISNNLSKVQNQALIKGSSDVNQLISDKKVLERELTKYKQSTQKLTKQLETLKPTKNSILMTSQELIISNAKSLSTFNDASQFNAFGQPSRPPAVPYHPSFYSSANQSLQNSIQQTSGSDRRDPFSQYYFKKVRDLQAEIMKMKKQFSEKKAKYKNQISKLKQEMQSKDAKINQINAFIVKQQSFIESFYNKQQHGQPKIQPTLSHKKSSASSSHQSPTHNPPHPSSQPSHQEKYYHQYQSNYNNQHHYQYQNQPQIPSTGTYHHHQHPYSTAPMPIEHIVSGSDYKGHQMGRSTGGHILGGRQGSLTTLNQNANINFNTQPKYQYDDIKRYQI